MAGNVGEPTMTGGKMSGRESRETEREKAREKEEKSSVKGREMRGEGFNPSGGLPLKVKFLVVLLVYLCKEVSSSSLGACTSTTVVCS